MTIFQVVEFYRENPVTVTVVVKSWIIKTTKDHLCYWPCSGTSKGEKAKRGAIPDRDKWQKYPVWLVPHSITMTDIEDKPQAEPSQPENSLPRAPPYEDDTRTLEELPRGIPSISSSHLKCPESTNMAGDIKHLMSIMACE